MWFSESLRKFAERGITADFTENTMLKPFHQKIIRSCTIILIFRKEPGKTNLAVFLIFLNIFQCLGEPSSYGSVLSVLKRFERGAGGRGAAVPIYC